jgi:hypothetical protein
MVSAGRFHYHAPMFRPIVCVAFLFFGACDSPANSGPDQAVGHDGMLQFEQEDLATATVDEGDNGDMALPPLPEDLGVPGDLMAAARPDMAAGMSGCGVKVNELLLSTLKGTTSRESEEYVELYNSCTTSIKLTGWSLVYRSGANNSGPGNADTQLVVDLTKTISAGGYLLWAGSQYTGTKDGSLVNGLSDSAGGVAVVDNHDTIVDSVAYGPVVSGHNFIEGSAAPLPPQTKQPGKVIARTPNGTDTGDNSSDFVVADPTPKASNN